MHFQHKRDKGYTCKSREEIIEVFQFTLKYLICFPSNSCILLIVIFLCNWVELISRRADYPRTVEELRELAHIEL